MTNLTAFAQNQPVRRHLSDAIINSNVVSKIEINKIMLTAGQAAAKHIHPCPVVGYVLSGKVRFQIEGQTAKILQAGDAFFEPKNAVILHFDNDDTDQPLTFIVFYLKEHNEDLIKLVK